MRKLAILLIVALMPILRLDAAEPPVLKLQQAGPFLRVLGENKEMVKTIERKEFTIFLFYGSNECSTCMLKQALPLEGLCKVLNSFDNFALCVLFSPNLESLESFISTAMNMQLRFPIYIDASSSFETLNPSIKERKDMQFCLLNQNGVPLLMGDPLESDANWMSYLDFISENGRMMHTDKSH